MTSFAAAYRESVTRHAHLSFVVTYGWRGERLTAKTFAEFDRDVVAVAGRLSGDQVVTVGGNTYEHLVYLAAAWLKGISSCALNPAETPDRLQAKVQQLGGVSQVFTDMKIPSLTLAKNFPEADPKRVMALAFTSGSTGYSKIVPQREESILANAKDLIARHGLKPGRVLATPLPIFHVNAQHFAFLCTLLSGAKLVLLESFVLPQAWTILQREEVNILSVVPQILRHMQQSPGSPDLPALEYVVSAAAPLSAELARAFVQRFGRRICQGYGLSEAVNFSCLVSPNMSTEDYRRFFLETPLPTIGSALGCNEVLVLDQSGTPLGAGEEGEIALRGVNVMTGYRGEGASVGGDGLFRTGDLGYFLETSTGERLYYISGRLKDIVKRGGLTISLREIDDVMASLKGVECISVPFAHDSTGEEIGLVFTSTSPMAEVQLTALVNERLPAHLRPVVALQVAGPLRTPSGKPTRWAFTPLFAEFSSRPLGRSMRIFDRR